MEAWDEAETADLEMEDEDDEAALAAAPVADLTWPVAELAQAAATLEAELADAAAASVAMPNCCLTKLV